MMCLQAHKLKGSKMGTLPLGFRFAVAEANFRNTDIKRHDLALAICDESAVAAAVFTTNLFKAAPVLCAQSNLKSNNIRAVLINSGQANACTGDKGMNACIESQRLIEEIFSLPEDSILPASTGVIGAHMDMQKWKNAAPQLKNSLGNTSVEDFARAIMTTDAFPKFIETSIYVDGKEVRFAAMAKGAGMICPNMATMLSMVITDAKVSQDEWQEAFHFAVDQSFNRVSVDGDTSTNDSLFGLASGKSDALVPLALLKETLTSILIDLSYLLVKDGEGATKVMHIDVSGAKTDADADAIARTIGHSQLVKTAMFGQDPNWGRIVAAAGRANVDFDPNKMQVILCGIELFNNGEPKDMDIDAVFREPFEKTDIPLQIILQEGTGKSHLKASDLSHAYVSCNADYRS